MCWRLVSLLLIQFGLSKEWINPLYRQRCDNCGGTNEYRIDNCPFDAAILMNTFSFESKHLRQTQTSKENKYSLRDFLLTQIYQFFQFECFYYNTSTIIPHFNVNFESFLADVAVHWTAYSSCKSVPIRDYKDRI